MSEERKDYTSDTRKACKYGTKCYQKNPEHLKQFKHPPQLKAKVNKRQNNRFTPYNKERKPHEAKTSENNIQNTNDEAKTSENNIGKVDLDANIVDESTTNINQDDEVESTSKPPQVIIDPEVPKYLVRSDSVTFYDKDLDPHDVIKECFLVDMPDDFFQFYKCLQEDTENVEKLLSTVNLQLIGPYELFLGKLPKLDDKELYLIHWRFFFDPPEFQVCCYKTLLNCFTAEGSSPFEPKINIIGFFTLLLRVLPAKFKFYFVSHFLS